MTISFDRSCGSLITSSGSRTAPNVTWIPLNTAYQCAIGCALNTSSRIAVSCGMFVISFAGSENLGSVRRSGRPIAFATGNKLVGRDDENKPGAVGRPIHVHRRICGILAVVQAEELRPAQGGLDRDACRPDALGEQRGRDIGSLAGALAPVERGDDRRIEPDGRGVVTAAGHRPRRRYAGIARHRQQTAARPV